MKLYSPYFEYIYNKSDEPFDLDALQMDIASLVVIGVPLFCIPDFQALKNLQDLWLVECSLQNADQLRCGILLRNIYLSSNFLTKIPDLMYLCNLKVLWLTGNLIEKINKGELPSTVEELNLADNRISYIGNSFQNCSNLETLNLSANPIMSMFELHHLHKLKRLKYLWLCDPLYDMSSICKLINYRSFVINCLPNLKQLDSHAIEECEAELTKIYFINKQNHYKLLSMNTTHDHYVSQEDNYKNTIYGLKKLKRNGYVLSLNEEKAKGKEEYKVLTLCNKLRKYLSHRIDNWEKKRIRTENQLEELRELKLRHMEIELEYFGNIKFKTHIKNSNLARLCEKVLNDFKCTNLKSIIDSIEVDLVTQVVRSGNLSLTAPISDNNFASQEGGTSVFILCDPLSVQETYEPFFNYIQRSLFFHESFSEGTENKKYFMPIFMSLRNHSTSSILPWEPVPKTVLLPNVTVYLKNQCYRTNFKGGMIFSKVVQMGDGDTKRSSSVGDGIKYTVSQCIASADYLLLDGTEANTSHGPSEMGKRIISLVFMDMDAYDIPAPKKEQNCISCYQSQEHICTSHNVAYILVTNPMLLVEFHYNQKNEELNKLSIEESLLMEREPYLPSQYAAESLFCNPKSWENLVKIEIVKLNLTAFGLTTPFRTVQDLNISYNKFSCMTEVCQLFPNLITLKASFNEFFLVPVNSEMVHFKYVDLSWNSMTNLKDILKWIKIKASKIETLNLKFNLFRDINESNHEVYLVSKTLPNLSIYNDMNLEKLIYQNTVDVCTIEDLSHFPLINQSAEFLKPKYMEQFKHNEFNEACSNAHTRKTHMRIDSQENITCLYLVKGQQFHDLEIKHSLYQVQSCTVTKNKLQKVCFLKTMNNVKHLNLSCNLLESLGGNLFGLNNIVTLNLSCNYITSLEELEDVQFPNLKFLDVSKNKLQGCSGIEGVQSIEELNISFNRISELDRFLFLKRYRKLRIIDVRNNGLEQADVLRKYLIYHVQSLEYVNGSPMTDSEINDAYNTIGGVLDFEYLESLNKNRDIMKLKHIDLINSSLKTVSLNSVKLFNLVSVNLDNNTLESIAEFLVLENLKFLSLAGNQISKFGKTGQCDIRTFPRLEELHLNRNGISSLDPLELNKMPNLKTLFLQDNQITSLKGIEHLSSLHHLILDRNKIVWISPNDVKKFVNLKELYLESNHVQKLDFLSSLKTIMRLFIKNNRIENIETLRFLKFLTKIEEFTFYGNPISRRIESYHKLCSYLPNLSYLDGFFIEPFSAVDSSSTSE